MWKRLSLSIGGAALIVSLVAGATFALFGANTGNGENRFTAGTVTLDTPVSTVVDVPAMVPGDNGARIYSVKYTGNVPAWMSLDATLTATADGDLVDCDPGKFVVAVSKGGPATALTSGNYALVQVFPTPVNPGDTTTFHIRYSLDRSAGDGCQGQSARLTLIARAVQATNNTTGGSPDSFGRCLDESNTFDSGACALAVGSSLSDTLGDFAPSSDGKFAGLDIYKVHFAAGHHTVTVLTPGDKVGLVSLDYGPAYPVNGQAQLTFDVVDCGCDYFFIVVSIPNQGGGDFTISAS